MKAFASGYKTVFQELPFKLCTPSAGTVPTDLKGTYYRAGPGMFSAGSIVPPKTFIVQPRQPPVPDGQDPSRMVQHPFEGDGAVLGVTFSDDSSVVARYRFVRTVAFTNERKKGAKMYTGMESTRAMGPRAGAGVGNDLPLPAFKHHLQAGLSKSRKNTSNLRAIYWGKRLMSLWEGGLPYKLDARALQTEGRSQLGGAVLKETDSFGGKMVVSGDRALFYGVQHELSGNSKLTVYEFDDAFRLVDRQTVDLPGFALITDFAASDNYAIFVTPAVITKGNMLIGSKAPGEALSFDLDREAVLTLVPRTGSNRRMSRIPLPIDKTPEVNLQFINAYETGNSVIIDAIRSDGSHLTESRPLRWPWGETLKEYQKSASKKSLWRYVVDLSSGSVTKRMVTDAHCLFGVVNPSKSTKQHQYIFMNIGGLGPEVAPPQGIAKIEIESKNIDLWMPEAHEFCGEPMYASRDGPDNENEDSGYILSVLFNGKSEESELLVLEASAISTGPITRIPLGIGIPHGLFGCFASGKDARWASDELSRRAKLTDKVESRGNMWNEVKSDFSGLGLRFDDMEEYFGDFFS